jgi:flavin-dependent dehydrogenase
VLVDEKLAWEKPCGGGLTYKAYTRYPFLVQNDSPKRFVTETSLAAPEGGEVKLKLNQPLVIYSRKELNALLLQRAEQAGAQLEKARVMAANRTGTGWSIQTSAGSIDANHCILALGARNPLREYGTRLGTADTMSALGYYVSGEQAGIDIQFLPNLAGYIWVFPRCGHMSVGICGKGEPASSLRKRLETYMDQRGLKYQGAQFYSHLLPCLDTPAWSGNRVAGEGWTAVGDAAGLVDPITGEGLYYALRSAELAADSLLAQEPPQSYTKKLGQDFGHDLEFGSRLANRIFHGSFLFGRVPARMVQFTRRSPLFKATIQDLFAGTQSYTGLRHRLLRNLSGSLWEVALSGWKQ